MIFAQEFGNRAFLPSQALDLNIGSISTDSHSLSQETTTDIATLGSRAAEMRPCGAQTILATFHHITGASIIGAPL